MLVLGAAGAIGAHAVRACLRLGWQVRALVRPTSDLGNLAELPAEVVSGDTRDAGSLARAIDGCSALVHAAGYYPASGTARSEAVARGLESVRPAFAVALEAGVRTGVYVSSLSTIAPGVASAVGGPRLGRESDEPPWAGPGLYGVVKAAMEKAALESADRGLPLSIVNPALCLGDLDRKPTSGRLVLEVGHGRVPGFPEAPVNVVYTGDVGTGIALALRRASPGRRYILGGTNTSYGWLLRQIAYQAGARPPRLRLPMGVARAGARLADLAARARGEPAMAAVALELVGDSQHLDGSRAATELDLPEPTSAVETVRRAVEWFRERGRLPPKNVR